MNRGTTRALLAVLLTSLTLLAGCTGVPDSSAPHTVAPVPLGEGNSSAAAPRRGVDPRTIVEGFLDANADAPSQRATAREYLTKSARTQWSDQKVTVIDGRQIQSYNSRTRSLQVTGRVVGTISAQGIYQPSLQGIGDGGRSTSFPFTLTTVDGQYRINELRSGLIITAEQFRQSFHQHVLYFNDVSGRRIVPDVRWTAIPTTDAVSLARWLVVQLVSGPRPNEDDSVAGNTFPAQADADRILVRSSARGTLDIEVPGSSQLPGGSRNSLALQLARTLADTGATLTITDDGAPVTIPSIGTTAFDLTTLLPSASLSPSPPDLYYLDGGRVTDSSGMPMSGLLGSGRYYLDSFALAGRGSQVSGGALRAAGVSNSQLSVGSTTAGLVDTSLRGLTSRPAWTPGLPELWVGVGRTLHRLDVGGTNGTAVKDTSVQLSTTIGTGSILAVRVSPDATQVALVIAAAGQSAGQLFVGAIVRDAGVRVGMLTQLSPAGVEVTDADWNTATKLSAIGYVQSTGLGSVFETGVDGSFWQNRGIGTLPAQPRSITASPYGAWVDAGEQVWRQSGSAWISPSDSGSSTGSSPTYVV